MINDLTISFNLELDPLNWDLRFFVMFGCVKIHTEKQLLTSNDPLPARKNGNIISVQIFYDNENGQKILLMRL